MGERARQGRVNDLSVGVTRARSCGITHADRAYMCEWNHRSPPSVRGKYEARRTSGARVPRSGGMRFCAPRAATSPQRPSATTIVTRAQHSRAEVADIKVWALPESPVMNWSASADIGPRCSPCYPTSCRLRRRSIHARSVRRSTYVFGRVKTSPTNVLCRRRSSRTASTSCRSLRRVSGTRPNCRSALSSVVRGGAERVLNNTPCPWHSRRIRSSTLRFAVVWKTAPTCENSSQEFAERQ